ncbi:hypothetical protein CEXT_95451 [Caerostris extrusa]|uniref:Uncharacterized protein n=1 Tax=Caerostris extrusa TaxID=172846 RepID=A0AAV4UVD5_CAEEX|nr:hypothetical protein CEXT_95451 [Caerostris extrusa]
MSREPSITRSTHGSYVQLNTFDEKEKAFVQNSSSSPPTLPYQRFKVSQYTVAENIRYNIIYLSNDSMSRKRSSFSS